MIGYFLSIFLYHLWTQRKTTTLFAYSGKKVWIFITFSGKIDYVLGKLREIFSENVIRVQNHFFAKVLKSKIKRNSKSKSKIKKIKCKKRRFQKQITSARTKTWLLQSWSLYFGNLLCVSVGLIHCRLNWTSHLV